MRLLFFALLCPIIIIAQINPTYVFKSNLYYSKLDASGDGLFGFEKDGKIGYMDKNEKIIIPAIYFYENTTYPSIPAFSKGYVRIKKDGKFGLLDKTGKVIIPFDYDYLNKTTSNYVVVGKQNGSKTLYGTVNLQNQPLIPIEYDNIQSDSSLSVLKQNEKWALFDNTGKKLLQTDYPTLLVYTKDKVLKAEKDGKIFLLDLNGNVIFEKAKSVYTLYTPAQGMILCFVSGKYGFLDMKGNEAIITKYDNAYSFENIGLAKVAKKISGSTYSYYYGYVDKKGNEVIPVKYETMGTFSEGLLIAKDPETNRYGYLDKTGKWIIKPAFLDGYGFDVNGGTSVKMTDGKWHYINKAGKDFGAFGETANKYFNADGFAVYENTDNPYVLIDKTGKTLQKLDDCDAIYNFSEGIGGYRCKSNSKYGFIDINGKLIGSCSYDGFNGFFDGVNRIEVKVSGKTKYGYINSKGEPILPAEYDDLKAFRSGWGIVKRDETYFAVDKSGNFKNLPRKYDNIYEFRSGFAIGMIKGSDNNHPNTYYYINTELKEQFNITAWEAYLFWDNVAIVKRDKDYELMNKNGEVFKTLTGIDNLKFCTEGMLAVKQRGKWGYINDKGDMMIAAKYDSCDQFKYGYGHFKLNNKWGLVDKNGNEVAEAKYDNILSGENGIFIFYDNGWSVMDKTGKILIPAKLFTVTTFEKDRALARLGKSYTILKSPLVK